MSERELTSPVPLTLPNGALNPDAIGWARQPLIDTSGIGRGWGARRQGAAISRSASEVTVASRPRTARPRRNA